MFISIFTPQTDSYPQSTKINPMEESTSSKKKVSFLPQNESHFNTSKHALTPSLSRIIAPQYQKPEERSAHCVAPPSTISRPNYEGFDLQN